MKVGELVSAPLYTITSDKSVQYAADLMNELKIGSLVVTEGEATIGIITSRDVRGTHPNRIVADAMSRNLKGVAPDVFVWNAWNLLNEYGIERLLVNEGERAIGLVTREQLRNKLSELRDPLTGLYRSAYIGMIGEDLLARRVPFQLLFIDLNNFGDINKTYGHPIGDDVIIDFANWLKSLLNANREYLSRYAGDEFVLITANGDERTDDIVRQLRLKRVIRQVEVSATVGVVGPRITPNFFEKSFRELISQASLLCSNLKDEKVKPE